MHMQGISSFLLFCMFATFGNAIIQYKVRGPPGMQRLPQHSPHHQQHQQHYMKSKWPMASRIPTRPYTRPIPVHMASYKIPVISRPPKTSAPLIFPSAVWKTPTAVYRHPVEKPFITSPPVTQSYEFMINKEPILNVPTIKQVGEKGPIHTIPAPNLSPEDKPKRIIQQSPKSHSYQYIKDAGHLQNAIAPNTYATGTLLEAQALPLVSTQNHEYQVTENAESNEHTNQYQNIKTYYAPDSTSHANFIQSSSSSNNNVKYYQPELILTQQQANNPSSGGIQLSAQDLYQLLNGMPQQQLIDSYGMPLVQQPQLQQNFVQQSQPVAAPNYQTVFGTAQFVQHEPSYYNQIPETMSKVVKDNFNPQFHTFNYEEQSSKRVPVPTNNFAQSRVTNYEENDEQTELQNPGEALAQTQYVQQYYTTQTADNNDSNDNNEVENNEQSNVKEQSQILSQLKAKNEIPSSIFYSSLPNKEAAETLATLQAAGSVNNMKLKQNGEQIRIYVPDEENYEDMETSGEQRTSSHKDNSGIRIYETTYSKSNPEKKQEDSLEYEDYSHEFDENKSEIDQPKQQQSVFGDKLIVKKQNTK